MSQVKQLYVAVPPDYVEQVKVLRQAAESTKARLETNQFGDRTEIVRFEQILTQLENIAFEALGRADVQTYSTPGPETLAVAWPFGPGVSSPTNRRLEVRRPSETWRSANPKASRTEATFERFEAQLRAWAESDESSISSLTPICPSGVQNRALTEALRRHVGAVPGANRQDAPIVYRDGSSARPIALRSLPISDEVPRDGRRVLRMTLLSVRHVEMDVEVDGAWLRNREISLPRARAQTDELVYQQSMEQLQLLGAEAPTTLYMHQTGLETANVAFYRAVIDYHAGHLGHPVAIVPNYFAGKAAFAPGTPWTIE